MTRKRNFRKSAYGGDAIVLTTETRHAIIRAPGTFPGAKYRHLYQLVIQDLTKPNYPTIVDEYHDTETAAVTAAHEYLRGSDRPDPAEVRRLRDEAMQLAIDEGWLPHGNEYGRNPRFSPGRFEGEPYYIAYFYNRMMEGDGEPRGPEDREYTLLTVSATERAAFPELRGRRSINLGVSDQGFVSLW